MDSESSPDVFKNICLIMKTLLAFELNMWKFS